MAAPKNKPTKPNHLYKIGFGVNQTEKINKAANAVNETPQQFIKNSTLNGAEVINAAAGLVKKK
ncbi:hypothetical protein [Erwinia sp. Leaf53]|uniref:hypothetical protein n=1 Tax=Erwinia sp. Leaf53 TaxID=1736225 RepID=UPI00092F4D5E|nr:hypothetical protein [Erwinia sp. Leaf53]